MNCVEYFIFYAFSRQLPQWVPNAVHGCRTIESHMHHAADGWDQAAYIRKEGRDLCTANGGYLTEPEGWLHREVYYYIYSEGEPLEPL